MATPHINAELGDIARVVLMPGDPLRAKYIADKYLKDVKLVNTVRNIFMFTGTYRRRRITIAASGMGNPSIGIYSYELYKFYNVECIMRIGSAGSYSKDLKIRSVLNVKDSYSNSTYAKFAAGKAQKINKATPRVVSAISRMAKKLDINAVTGRAYCNDVFYVADPKQYEIWRDDYKCLAVEMETTALFTNARILGKQAGCMLTISDNVVTGEGLPAEERQSSFDEMAILSLETAVNLDKKYEKEAE